MTAKIVHLTGYRGGVPHVPGRVPFSVCSSIVAHMLNTQTGRAWCGLPTLYIVTSAKDSQCPACKMASRHP